MFESVKQILNKDRAMILSLVLTPFSLVWVVLCAFVRAVKIGRQVCWEVGMAVLSFYLELCWSFMASAIAISTLPVRLFTALHAQIKLEEQLLGMKRRLENLADENKELEECLLVAFQERKVVDKVLQDMEEEQKMAFTKIELLQNEIHHLKVESLGLSHAQGKESWNWKTSTIKEGGVILQDIMIHGEQERGRRSSSSSETNSNSTFEVQKKVAIRRSLFSTILSFLVGLIIWEAEDPCLPLVAALFIVVGMSISSVVQFFFTIKNKPASDAVALLSINCFMLGTITCPTLPRVAVMCAPWAMRVFDWLFG